MENACRNRLRVSVKGLIIELSVGDKANIIKYGIMYGARGRALGALWRQANSSALAFAAC